MKHLTLRGWATPLLMGAFFLMAGTGVVMFFKFDNGLMAPLHRILSWIFLIGAIGHITANVRPFGSHLKSTWGRISVAFFCSLLLISFYSWGRLTTPKVYSSMANTLISAPLAAVAAIRRMSPEELVGSLRRAGITCAADQSIREVAAANHTSEERLLSAVFASQGEST